MDIVLLIYKISIPLAFIFLSNLKFQIKKRSETHKNIQAGGSEMLLYSFIPVINTWYVITKIYSLLKSKPCQKMQP